MKQIFQIKTERFQATGKLSDDKIKLFVDVIAHNLSQIRGDELVDEFKKYAPLNLLHVDVINKIAEELSAGKEVKERRIAKGEEAKAGSDGKLLILIKKLTLNSKSGGSVDERGYAHFADLHLFDNVLIGTKVARIYPPKEGVDGIDATGKPIKAQQGKPFKSNFDKSLAVVKESEYDSVVAQSEGYLAEDAGKLVIKNEITISDNLDLHYGNIDFIGAIKVSKDVVSGLIVRAKTGITVQGDVRGSALISYMGDIHVKGHVAGDSTKGFLSGKSLYIKVAQNLTADVRGDIHLKKEALDCFFRVEGALKAEEASFVGGSLLTSGGAIIKKLGNEVGKETIITFGTSVETTTEFAELLLHIQSTEKAIFLLKTHLGPLADNPQRVELLKDPYKSRMKQLLQKLEILRSGKVKLEAKKQELLLNAKLPEELWLTVTERAYSGVKVRAFEKEFVFMEEKKGAFSLVFSTLKKEFYFADKREVGIKK